MIDAYKRLWNRGFDFSVRSNRGDYWWAILANTIIAYALLEVGAAAEAFIGLYALYCFAAINPGLSICIRRARDAGKG